jgi:hypothetical protein
VKVQDGGDGTPPRTNELDDPPRICDPEVLDAVDHERPIVSQRRSIGLINTGDLCQAMVKEPGFDNIGIHMRNIDVQVSGRVRRPI